MSISAALVCHDCQLEFYLGKPLRTYEDVIFAFTEGRDPNSKARYLEANRVVWKILAEHMRHWIDISVEGYNERDECYLFLEESSDFERSVSIESFLENFDDSPNKIPQMNWEYSSPVPYRPGFFVCYDCKHRLYLGKAIRNPSKIGGIQFFYKDNPEKIPNSKNSELSQGLWKMMVDHAKHHIGVIVGEESTEDWLKIGEDDQQGPRYVSLKTYISDWNWGRTQEAIEMEKSD